MLGNYTIIVRIFTRCMCVYTHTLTLTYIRRCVCVCVSEYECETFVYRNDFVEWYKSLPGKKEFPHSELSSEEEAAEDANIYEQKFVRELQEPRDVRRRLQEGTITEFPRTPVSIEIDIPEFDVFEGGINYNYSHIRLTHVDGGR